MSKRFGNGDMWTQGNRCRWNTEEGIKRGSAITTGRSCLHPLLFSSMFPHSVPSLRGHCHVQKHVWGREDLKLKEVVLKCFSSFIREIITKCRLELYLDKRKPSNVLKMRGGVFCPDLD